MYRGSPSIFVVVGLVTGGWSICSRNCGFSSAASTTFIANNRKNQQEATGNCVFHFLAYRPVNALPELIRIHMADAYVYIKELMRNTNAITENFSSASD